MAKGPFRLHAHNGPSMMIEIVYGGAVSVFEFLVVTGRSFLPVIADSF